MPIIIITQYIFSWLWRIHRKQRQDKHFEYTQIRSMDLRPGRDQNERKIEKKAPQQQQQNYSIFLREKL